ncbi:DUF4238 domain-containing protein [Nocardia asiatica]|uniref:DUF4238 domain-containing protein n=1 Tax=Nocardia asiatica TaxID=209252 RepID=UPI002456A52B|nr:DUF4238 domain-containing protein [Nocardia asiatica]
MTTIDEEWFRTADRFGKVGSRHHVIPRLILQKWADSSDQVWAKSKHDRREGIRNIYDLAIKDFYTFLATDGQLDSTFEELLSVFEKRGAAVLKRLNNPFTAEIALSPDEFIHLAEFVAIQIARSPRRRREHELMVDWYAKTVAAGTRPGRLSEQELRTLEFTPHQNEHIDLIIPAADKLTRELMRRPVAMVTLDRPLLLIGDEMVVLNTAGDPHHSPDCAMTDAQFTRKIKRASRKKKGRPQRHEVARLAHIYTTQPRDIEAAVEIAMPISPRTVLLFGPAAEWEGHVVREQVCGPDADQLAERINDTIIEYSLDVIVGRVDAPSFRALPIPEPAPLLAVCGATGAAKDAVMTAPKRLRPKRLDRRQTGLVQT